MMLNVVYIIPALLNLANSIAVNVTVNGLGIAIGKLEESKWSGKKFYSFRGIPFAKPPIGNLRFAPPLPADSWNGNYLDATNFGNICPQTKQVGYGVEGYDEDCLNLNVYVPEGGKRPLPVMIWIHGGSFMSGYAGRFEPHYIMESNVILVVPQFRLGPLGLLCLETEEIPGNVQFLDQIMAMKWVQDNIGYFDGDKNEVTLFGQSSGGSSVNLHLLSPLSRGLFNATIIQSNSILTPAIIDRNPVETTKAIASFLGCGIDDTSQITECMKNLPVKSMLEGFDKYIAKNSLGGGDSWGGNRIVIQKFDEGVKFLTEEPSDLIQRGEFLKLPMMGGTTSEEGSFITSSFYDALSKNELRKDRDFLENQLVPWLLKALAVKDDTGALLTILTDKYFRGDEYDDFLKMVPGITDISTVLFFKTGIIRMLNENRRFKPTYLYNFEYRGSQTRFGYETGIEYPFDGGVAHADDYIYLFPFPDKLSENDTLVAKRLVKLWTSFAINRVPSADEIEEWPKMSSRNGPYLKIGLMTKIGSRYSDEYEAAVNKSTLESEDSKNNLLNTFWIIEAMRKCLMILLM